MVLAFLVYLPQHAALGFDTCCVTEKPDAFKEISLLYALDSKCVDGIDLSRVVLFEFGSWSTEETFPKPDEIDRMHLEWVNQFI